ncbi:unnamed protein product [Triticum turgidum subsp. durum]|uniref:Calcineurin-like phosphoesterase domain-containing protein n=1 Tax=Triticum turgidum subsp. durum TaxID=4567 RepID=A0A9R1PQ62_TRITD|nr:unnamed protein product [Triticum turgidum subsp. durum]
MERVRTILTHTPYPHEHSRHIMTAVIIGCLFFISSDNMHTLIHKLDSNIKWWSMYVCLIGFFYFFSSPFLGRTIQPSYSNFNRWYVAWICFASLYHLPSFQSMGVDMRMNLSLFLTIYFSSVLFITAFHIIFIGLWTSADLFKTAFDLMVSVTLFVGRFDMRMMQAAMKSTTDETRNDDVLYDYFNEREDLWFDFVADTGDGGNSSYTVARLLAQPSIQTVIGGSMHTLPRGNLLVIGGDLAYPNPSSFTYERRFFGPFEYAMQPPRWYKAEHIAVDKPEVPPGVSKMKKYDGPQCFIIPGNHDWFDGLHTFMRYICHKSWLGGWFLPQKKSYFALQLPKGWWIFGLDLALHGDIDVYQFKFFAELCRNKVGENDSVIIVTHEPNWLLDWYWKEITGKNVSHLIQDYLNGRCKLRMAGDLHHFMRHSATPSDKPTFVEHLLVNGCGGAFLHPTHVFKNFERFSGTTYECKAAYPSYEESSGIALGNILKFRKKNWQFDIIGGFIYFILVFSMFPQKVSLLKNANLSTTDLLLGSWALKYVYGIIYWQRQVITLYMIGIGQWKVMAVTRINICKNGMMSLSRSVLIMYYTSVFIYFWIFSTPVVSLIFGSYLYICINWFHIHFDEAFSSLRIANYKSFTRFHIKKDGDLEIFTLAVDKVGSIINTLNLVNRSQRIGSWIPSGRQRKEGLISSATTGDTLANGGQPHLQTPSGRCGSLTISPSQEQ